MTTLFLLLACSGSKTESTPAESTADSQPKESEAPPCVTVNSGTEWSWYGECPQMPTPCDIVVTECAMAIDYEADGGMTMGMPFAATISGSTITFEDGSSVPGCTGTVMDADHIEGSCEGGCTFELRQGR